MDNTQQQQAIASLGRYEGLKSRIFRELGEGSAAELLHLAFNGNASAAAEFLGFSKQDSVSLRFTRNGLSASGHDVPRRDYKATSDARKQAPDAPNLSEAQFGWTDDDWWRYFLGRTSEREWAIPVEWRVSRGTEFGVLHALGDLHFGSADQDLPKLLEMVEYIRSMTDDRWILCGDLFEVATKTGKSSPAIAPQDVCYRMAVRALQPIAAQCLVGHSGNHDMRIVRTEAMPYDPCRQLCAELNIPWGGMDGFHTVTLTDGKRAQKYTGYVHHGYGGARTKGARQKQLHDKLRDTTADYAVMAHLHDRDGTTETRFGPDETGEIGRRYRAAIRCGAFDRFGPDSYARQAGFPPGVPGAGTLHLYLSKSDVHART